MGENRGKQAGTYGTGFFRSIYSGMPADRSQKDTFVVQISNANPEPKRELSRSTGGVPTIFHYGATACSDDKTGFLKDMNSQPIAQ